MSATGDGFGAVALDPEDMADFALRPSLLSPPAF